MNKFVLIICLLFSLPGAAKTIKFAVLDTGYSNNLPNLKVCPDGLKDFTGQGMYDKIGHGTNILGIIAKELKNVDYCVYIYKVYGGPQSLNNTFYMQALVSAYYVPDLQLINYSSSGNYSEVEEAIIKLLLKKNIKLIAAAGNDNQDLDKKCDIYPACQQGVISVGNIDAKGNRQKDSNYGKRINVWEYGCDSCVLNQCFTGTSMSAALHSAKLVKEMQNVKNSLLDK